MQNDYYFQGFGNISHGNSTVKLFLPNSFASKTLATFTLEDSVTSKLFVAGVELVAVVMVVVMVVVVVVVAAKRCGRIVVDLAVVPEVDIAETGGR